MLLRACMKVEGAGVSGRKYITGSRLTASSRRSWQSCGSCLHMRSGALSLLAAVPHSEFTYTCVLFHGTHKTPGWRRCNLRLLVPCSRHEDKDAGMQQCYFSSMWLSSPEGSQALPAMSLASFLACHMMQARITRKMKGCSMSA